MLNSLFLQSCFFKFPSFINLHSIASAFPPYDSSWKKRMQNRIRVCNLLRINANCTSVVVLQYTVVFNVKTA